MWDFAGCNSERSLYTNLLCLCTHWLKGGKKRKEKWHMNVFKVCEARVHCRSAVLCWFLVTTSADPCQEQKRYCTGKCVAAHVQRNGFLFLVPSTALRKWCHYLKYFAWQISHACLWTDGYLTENLGLEAKKKNVCLFFFFFCLFIILPTWALLQLSLSPNGHSFWECKARTLKTHRSRLYPVITHQFMLKSNVFYTAKPHSPQPKGFKMTETEVLI